MASFPKREDGSAPHFPAKMALGTCPVLPDPLHPPGGREGIRKWENVFVCSEASRIAFTGPPRPERASPMEINPSRLRIPHVSAGA